MAWILSTWQSPSLDWEDIITPVITEKISVKGLCDKIVFFRHLLFPDVVVQCLVLS